MILRRSTIGFTSLVWATIATTLFATSPHLECLCPDGGRKPFCLSLLLGGPSYCYREVKPQDDGTCCCCGVPEAREDDAVLPRAGRPGSSDPGIQRSGCEGSVAPTLTAISERANQFADVSIVHLNAVHVVVDRDLATTGVPQSTVGIISLPNPPDLVLVLQRLLI